MTTVLDRPGLLAGIHRRHAGPVALLTVARGAAPRCCLPEPCTVCECGGLLGYVRGAWVHADQCPVCCTGPARSCPAHHPVCADPAPRTCTHDHCRQPVRVVPAGTPWPDRCVFGDSGGCCGCCWDLTG